MQTWSVQVIHVFFLLPWKFITWKQTYPGLPIPHPPRSCIIQVGVSKNRGTPKSSILIGFSIINHPFWGTPIFGNTQVVHNPLRGRGKSDWIPRACHFPRWHRRRAEGPDGLWNTAPLTMTSCDSGKTEKSNRYLHCYPLQVRPAMMCRFLVVEMFPPFFAYEKAVP